MRNLLIGILIGMALGGGIAYASSRITLINGSGVETGTTTDPLYVTLY